jgi:hypothetical protein
VNAIKSSVYMPFKNIASLLDSGIGQVARSFWFGDSTAPLKSTAAEMSERTTPVTPIKSRGEASRQESTQPSSPLAAGSADGEDNHKEEGRDEHHGGEQDVMDIPNDEEDTEGMDVKARALTNLLKTSSVCCPFLSIHAFRAEN